MCFVFHSVVDQKEKIDTHKKKRLRVKFADIRDKSNGRSLMSHHENREM